MVAGTELGSAVFGGIGRPTRSTGGETSDEADQLREKDSAPCGPSGPGSTSLPARAGAAAANAASPDTTAKPSATRRDMAASTRTNSILNELFQRPVNGSTELRGIINARCALLSRTRIRGAI